MRAIYSKTETLKKKGLTSFFSQVKIILVKRQDLGFTLIETTIIMIVIVIISVIATISINGAINGMKLTSATDKLANDLRYASTMANGMGLWYGVSFEADPVNQYSIYTTNGTTDTLVEDPSKFGRSLIINVDDDYGVIISSVNIDSGKKVEFDPYGAPYTDKNGSLISTEGIVTLSNSAGTRTVRISPNTGRVYIQ